MIYSRPGIRGRSGTFCPARCVSFQDCNGIFVCVHLRRNRRLQSSICLANARSKSIRGSPRRAAVSCFSIIHVRMALDVLPIDLIISYQKAVITAATPNSQSGIVASGLSLCCTGGAQRFEEALKTHIADLEDSANWARMRSKNLPANDDQQAPLSRVHGSCGAGGWRGDVHGHA